MNEINLIIPTDWNDVTLNQWKNLIKLSMEKNEDESIYELKLKQVHIFNPHIDIDILKKMRISQIKDYFNLIEGLDDKEPIKKEVNEVTIDGKTYKLLDFNHLSLEQWIDGEKYSNIEDAHKLIALFYIHPDEYNEVELEKVADWFDKQPAPISFYLVGRFFFIQKVLEKTMDLYLEKMEKIAQQKKLIKQSKEKVMKWFGFKSLKKLLKAT